jgi:hypothetical protein
VKRGECGGIGYTECECIDCGDEHEVDCRECDGAGWDGCQTCEGRGFRGTEQSDRRGIFAGKPFNQRVMALAVEGAPGETVRLAWGRKHETAFMLEGDGWRGVVMPLLWRSDEECAPIEDMPGFPEPAPTEAS